MFTEVKIVRKLSVEAGVRGVTSLAGEIYVLTNDYQIEAYDVITYQIQRCLTVPGASSLWDMTSCEKHICLYFADSIGKCIDKFSVRSDLFTRWDVHDQPFGLSVNSAHNVLVTCRTVCKIKEFSSDGDLLRELTLPDDVTHPYHAIQIPSREYIVCFGGPSDAVRAVLCKILS